MVKSSPVTVISKTRKTPKKTVSSKKKKTRGKKPRHKKVGGFDLPYWLLVTSRVMIVAVFALAFYHFFIRPYSYRWKPCYGCKEYGVCIPFGYQVHGMDISHYQGDIDWDNLIRNQSARYPLQFVFIKATEGGDLNDVTFSRNFEAARHYGFIRGAYHFYNPATSPLKQADFFIQTVKLDTGDLPPVLDIEKLGKKNPEELKKELKVWLDRVEAHYQVKPILYTSYKFKNRYLNDSVFNSYPYWIAHYYVDSVEYKGEWKFWQHTDVATIAGVPESADLNIFNGNLEELSRMTIGWKKE